MPKIINHTLEPKLNNAIHEFLDKCEAICKEEVNKGFISEEEAIIISNRVIQKLKNVSLETTQEEGLA